jgi:hypothetical protein
MAAEAPRDVREFRLGPVAGIHPVAGSIRAPYEWPTIPSEAATTSTSMALDGHLSAKRVLPVASATKTS